MRGSHAKAIPQAFEEWLAWENDCWSPSYAELSGPVKQAVVKALHEAQRGLCVYCGRRLDMRRPGQSYHIEHFRPQSKPEYRKLSTDIANLFLSCGQENPEGNRAETCGTAKGDGFDENCHIEPDYPDCTERFRFLLNGDVAPQSNGDMAAEPMIALLNLNHRELKKSRADLLDRIDGGSLDISDFIDAAGGPAQDYAHMACRHLGATIP